MIAPSWVLAVSAVLGVPELGPLVDIPHVEDVTGLAGHSHKDDTPAVVLCCHGRFLDLTLRTRHELAFLSCHSPPTEIRCLVPS